MTSMVMGMQIWILFAQHGHLIGYIPSIKFLVMIKAEKLVKQPWRQLVDILEKELQKNIQNLFSGRGNSKMTDIESGKAGGLFTDFLEDEILYVSLKDYETMLKAIENPEPPPEALTRLIKESKNFFKEENKK